MTLANDTHDTRQIARDSFSGRGLTDAQFEEAWAISAVLHSEINQNGTFREKLTDYAHAFARAEKFDALRGETILRDLYAARYGETLNQTRVGLADRLSALPSHAPDRILAEAEGIKTAIQTAPTQPFYLAYDRAAGTLADSFGITRVDAKTLMKEAYEARHGQDLYTVGKAVEAEHHRPQRDAQSAQRVRDQRPAQAPKPQRSRR